MARRPCCCLRPLRRPLLEEQRSGQADEAVPIVPAHRLVGICSAREPRRRRSASMKCSMLGMTMLGDSGAQMLRSCVWWCAQRGECSRERANRCRLTAATCGGPRLGLPTQTTQHNTAPANDQRPTNTAAPGGKEREQRRRAGPRVSAVSPCLPLSALERASESHPAHHFATGLQRPKQGDYCLQVRMDLIPSSGIVAIGAQQFEVPARAQSVMRQVCFTKLATRPQANITFHSCNTSFAVDLTGITPKPAFSRCVRTCRVLLVAQRRLRLHGSERRSWEADAADIVQLVDGCSKHMRQPAVARRAGAGLSEALGERPAPRTRQTRKPGSCLPVPCIPARFERPTPLLTPAALRLRASPPPSPAAQARPAALQHGVSRVGQAQSHV